MKSFKLLLVAVTMTPVLTLAETTVPLIAGGGTVTSESIVGDVIVSNDGSALNITYQIDSALIYDPDAPSIANEGKWCITETHTEVGDSLESFPLTNAKKGEDWGSPKIGHFAYSDEYEYVSSAEVIVNPIPDNGGNVVIGAHAVVKQFNLEPDLLAEFQDDIKFRTQMNMEVWPATNTYLVARITEAVESPRLNSEYHSWCIDPNHPIMPYADYVGVYAVSSYDRELVDPQLGDEHYDYVNEHIENTENLPKVNFMLNQRHDGAYDDYSMCDFQQALWVVTNNQYGPEGSCPSHTPANVDAIVADAEAGGTYNTEGDYYFKPECGDIMAVVMLGNPNDTEQAGIQTVIIHIDVPCKGVWGDETAWGGLYKGTETINRFVSSNWAMWFEHEIE